MTKKQRDSLTVVLLLMVNIEYNLSVFFLTFIPEIGLLFFACVYPSQATIQEYTR